MYTHWEIWELQQRMDAVDSIIASYMQLKTAEMSKRQKLKLCAYVRERVKLEEEIEYRQKFLQQVLDFTRDDL